MEKLEEKEIELTTTGVGKNDRLPYAKADLVKVVKVQENIALSFYQLDYQAVALKLKQLEKDKNISENLIPVGKIIMDNNTFAAFFSELSKINDKLISNNLQGNQNA